MVIPERNAAPINEDAIKTSSGALMSLPICRERSLRRAMESLQQFGLRIVSITEKGNDTLPDMLSGTDMKTCHLKMEGNRLFKQAVSSMAGIAEQALSRNQLSRDQISLVIPHQANLRILQAVAEKLQIPMGKVFTNLEKYGNTSSASIPLAMDEACRSGVISNGDYVLLISFGAGLTWGGTVIQWTL